MKIIVASDNPVKIDAARVAFSRYFGDVQAEGVPAASSVAAQPMGADTYRGAEHRARVLFERCQAGELDADYCVGIEGGAISVYDRWFVLGVMCIIDRAGRIGFGASPEFELPEKLAAPLVEGTELGEIIDHLTGEQDSKRRGGAIGFLTGGVMDRRDFYVQGLLVALVPFLNESLYFVD